MSSIVSVRGEPVNVVVTDFAYDVSINKMQNIDTQWPLRCIFVL